MQCKYDSNVPFDLFSKIWNAFDCDTGFVERSRQRRDSVLCGFRDHVVLIQLVVIIKKSTVEGRTKLSFIVLY